MRPGERKINEQDGVRQDVYTTCLFILSRNQNTLLFMLVNGISDFTVHPTSPD